jgi:hypothetical protein
LVLDIEFISLSDAGLGVEVDSLFSILTFSAGFADSAGLLIFEGVDVYFFCSIPDICLVGSFHGVFLPTKRLLVMLRIAEVMS